MKIIEVKLVKQADYGIEAWITQLVKADAYWGVNWHQNIYKTDCISITMDGNTEQLLMEQMINSVHVSSMQHMEKLE